MAKPTARFAVDLRGLARYLRYRPYHMAICYKLHVVPREFVISVGSDFAESRNPVGWF